MRTTTCVWHWYLHTCTWHLIMEVNCQKFKFLYGMRCVHIWRDRFFTVLFRFFRSNFGNFSIFLLLCLKELKKKNFEWKIHLKSFVLEVEGWDTTKYVVLGSRGKRKNRFIKGKDEIVLSRFFSVKNNLF